MRTSDLAFALIGLGLASACSSASETSQQMVDTARGQGRAVACRIANAADFTDDCMLEWRGGGDNRLLVLRHAAGGFRRLLVSSDGTIGQADGAEPIALTGQKREWMELTIGADQYRLTAVQLRPSAP